MTEESQKFYMAYNIEKREEDEEKLGNSMEDLINHVKEFNLIGNEKI